MSTRNGHYARFQASGAVWGIRSSEMLRSVDWYVNADVSGQPTCPIFKGQTVRSRNVWNSNQRCLTSQKNKYFKWAVLISGVLPLLFLFYWNCLRNERELNSSWFRHIKLPVISYIIIRCVRAICTYSELKGRCVGLSLDALTKLRKATISFVMSVCLSVRPHGTSRLPLDGFSWNLIFGYFSRVCRGIFSFIKIWQE
jgi:hypothetical protein